VTVHALRFFYEVTLGRPRARFNTSTRKLLSRHARDLQVCILNGHHFEDGDYARIVLGLEALQAAIAKVVTDLAIVAEEE
jgi:hypothetical protein